MRMSVDYRRFVPLNSLSDEARAEVAGLVRRIRLDAGQTLFRQG